jgi:4-methyl-5(b-hydroxyethyl)-thiazole monophosphate biosynthesis
MVYIFLADGFETIEALAAADVLRRAGIELRTVGSGSSITCGR